MDSNDVRGTMDDKPPLDFLFFLGGNLAILAGIMALANGLMGASIGSTVAIGPDSPVNRLTICSVLVIIFGMIAIAGGLSAIRGKHFTLALVGAVLGMVGGGWGGFFVGVGAIVLFMMSNQDL